MPKTTFGKWSFYLILTMPVLLIIVGTIVGNMYQNVPAGNTIWEDITSRPLVAVSALLALGTGISSFATGLYAIIKQGERSWLVYISTGIGALLLLFLAGEFILTH